MHRYVYELSTECVAGESMIACHVWRVLNVNGRNWLMRDLGVTFCGTVEEAIREAQDIAACDRELS